MKILVAPDSFKGSLEAIEVCNVVERAAREVFEGAEVSKLPMADGGEGTVVAVLSSLKGEEVTANVQSPDFRKIEVKYGMFHGDKAVMEMAEASGITKVACRDIFRMNTFGTGEMVLDAIHRGARTIYIGIGGSATNDGGIGFASALGVKFLDQNGKNLLPIPENLHKIASIDDSGIEEKVKQATFIVMSDVKNPLLGENGATYIFGKQKGATQEMLPILEAGMAHYADVLEAKYGRGIREMQGAGAAGGLGMGMIAFVGAKVQSGITTILDILNFDAHLQGVHLVVTGEGRMDAQSAFGKVAFGVGEKCQEKNIPCIALVGGLGEHYEEMYAHGISSIMTTVDRVMSLEEAINDAEDLCHKAAIRAFRMLKAGQSLRI